MEKKIMNLVSLIINALIVILGTIAVLMQIFSTGGTNGVDVNSLGAFRFFTNDGNIFVIIASAITLVYNILIILNKKEVLPKYVSALKLMATVSSAIIFLVVMFMLLPTLGINILSGYVMIVLHAINPILCIASYLVFEPHEKNVSIVKAGLGGLPVYVNGIVAIILCVSKVWTGTKIPYFFLDVYNNEIYLTVIYCIVILGGAFGLGILFNFLNEVIKKKLCKN